MGKQAPFFECYSILEPKLEQFENPRNIVNLQLGACLKKDIIDNQIQFIKIEIENKACPGHVFDI